MSEIGLINVYKLPGMSSHEVVARIRRLIGIKRVGHTGTLDPAACGVLVVCIGKATRLADYIAAECKGYRAEITFGLTTDSADADGALIADVDAGQLTEAEVIRLLPQFTGVIQQRPPAHSAVQIGGRRAYDLIRQGHEVEIPMREVTIDAFTPALFVPGRHPRLLADITCSKGTYIRSLARDLGEAAGVGATLTFLARTRVGAYEISDAVTIDELWAAADAGALATHIQPADTAVSHLPALVLPETADTYRQGTFITVSDNPGLYRVYLGHQFLGLGRVEAGVVRPVVNLL